MADVERCRKYVEALCRRARSYYDQWLAADTDPVPLREDPTQ